MNDAQKSATKQLSRGKVDTKGWFILGKTE